MGNRALFAVSISLVVLVMTLASCAPGSKGIIQPLSSVPQGVDGPHVRDIGPNSVRIIFTSGVPVVCNVAYGTDKSYGKLAVMPMAGATIEHELFQTLNLAARMTSMSSAVWNKMGLPLLSLNEL